jgi:glycosyltransferase involved in cell wall biosynthesis
MKVAVCCFYEAYPPVSGAAAVSFNIAKFLPSETLLVQAGSRPGSTEVHGIRVVTVAGGSEGNIKKLATLRTRLLAMVDELCRFRPDLVMLEGASWAVYLWMLFRAIRRTLPQVRIVYHAHNIEYLLRRQRHGRAIGAITRWAEGRLLANCDFATAVSEVDRGLFRELYKVDTMLFPNGVDATRFASVSPGEAERARSAYGIGNSAIIFSGLYTYPPNRMAIDFLLRDVMPNLLVHLRDARLVITGGHIPQRERWLITPGIVPHDELPALLASCKVAVAPIFSGSGTRLKILEAMAAGVPVVATSKGAEGLPFVHREHLLIANDAAAFVESLRAIMEPGLRNILLSNARNVVRQYFDWRAIAPLTLRMHRDCAIQC